MRVLISASRFPWPPYTGDRLRTAIWLDALRETCDVTLIAPRGVMPQGYENVRHVVLRRSPFALAGALVRTIVGSLPIHALMTAPYDWSGAFRRAREAGDYDVEVVILSRCDPWVEPNLRAKRRILDAIDSLAASVGERAREARRVMRVFWRMEQRRMTKLESSASDRYDAVVVVAAEERSAFGPNGVDVPNGVEIGPRAPTAARRYDFAFWGRLSYFANRDAAMLLLETIWPAIRQRMPEAKLLIAGADAPEEVRRFSGRDGVEVVSPIGDRPALLREVKIALFPVRFGTGQSNKILEAAEASCGIVATPAAVRGFAEIAKSSAIEPDIERLAERAVGMGTNENSLRRAGEEVRELVERKHSRESTLIAMRELLTRGRG